MTYKHTQIGYFMIVVIIAVLGLFAWTYITSALEPASVDSGNNLLTTATMVLVLFILTSFTTLQVHIDKQQIGIKFGYGVYKNKFTLNEIASVKRVRNPRYTGWGIRRGIGCKMRIFNISGFDAVELQMKNGRIYRIGTDEPKKLEQAILTAIRGTEKK